MRKIKKGDIVGRISYGKDIFFIVEDIINLNKNEIAILKGLTIRIKADSPVEDLEILSKELISASLSSEVHNNLAAGNLGINNLVTFE
jgi:spore coat assembly protein